MRPLKLLIMMLFACPAVVFPQLRTYVIHQRGMLHETEYNTGEIGRAYDNGGSGGTIGVPSFEWPAYSTIYVDQTKTNNAQYNSFGGGIYIAANFGWDTKDSARVTVQCGAVTDQNGNTVQVENLFSYPISLQRIENYPVLANGNLNPAYNPDEAEEIIIAKWATPIGVTVTRTSRAWSVPGYDSFIIYEYELDNDGNHNTDVRNPGVADTLRDVMVAWGYGLAPSMFGYMRTYNRWSEADFRAKDQFARFDLTRWMVYNQDRNGKPDPTHFQEWATTGEYGGGLDSPQAVGIVPLYYDYAHLDTVGHTHAQVGSPVYDSVYVIDSNKKFKQPYINRYENSNVYQSKIFGFLDCYNIRKTSPFTVSPGENDSVSFGSFWLGRTKPSWTLETRQPVSHIYGFGPYFLPPGQSMHFSMAEVAGYGPGVASDSVYEDLGGGYGGDISEPLPGKHPVPSWYHLMSYQYVGGNGTIGSDYLSKYPLPSYVDPKVISVRDVADRAIQTYTGGPLIKYDTTQFDPEFTPSTGAYKVPIPIPVPNFTVEDTRAALNRLTWGPQVESFDSLLHVTHPASAARVEAGFSYYEVLRTDHPLSPWTRIDSVGIRDPRFFQDSVYVVVDPTSLLGESYYYAIVSVDSMGGMSGKTNIILHQTQAPADVSLNRVYVVPNPFIVRSGFRGASTSGDISDKIGFFGLPKIATIRIYSYVGQLVQTIQHNADQYSVEWFQVTRNNQIIASGVYYFTVEDPSGKRTWGKFVVIK